MNIAAKIITLAGMLATVAWFFWNPNGWVFQWEPIAAFLFALAGYIAAEKSGENLATNSQKTTTHPNDIRLLNDFLCLMPSGTFIEFLKQHDFLLDFKMEDLSPLRKFINEWDNTEHEFQDIELENIRTDLLKYGIDFFNKVCEYTSPNDAGRQAVRVDRLKHVKEHEDRFREEAKIINDASGEFVKIHQKLTEEGRKKCDLTV